MPAEVVPRFASREWIEALDAAAARVDLGEDAAAAEGFVLQQVVTGDPPAAWSVAVADGRVRYRSGRADAPDVTLTSDLGTARAVHLGHERAQAAFMAGRIRIGGDPTALVRVQAVLARLDGELPSPE